MSSENIIITFLNAIGIKCESINNLEGLIIERNYLLNNELYNSCKQEFNNIKTVLKSSVYTSMQKNAIDNQKWPLINLTRQLLKRFDYSLVPKRECDGYDKDGKKKYKRLFIIKKSNLENNTTLSNN